MLHFGDVLVGLIETVLTGRIKLRCSVFVLVLRYHLFAAAAVACQRGAGKDGVGHNDARPHEGGDQRDKSAGVASGVCYPFGILYRIVRVEKFGKTVCPGCICSVCGGRVNYGGVGIVNKRNRLYRRSIGQTKKSYIRKVIIEEGVTTVGDNAFAYCTSMTEITIPKRVTEIGNYAFRDCEMLTIYCEAKAAPATWANHWNIFCRPVVWDYKAK